LGAPAKNTGWFPPCPPADGEPDPDPEPEPEPDPLPEPLPCPLPELDGDPLPNVLEPKAGPPAQGAPLKERSTDVGVAVSCGAGSASASRFQ